MRTVENLELRARLTGIGKSSIRQLSVGDRARVPVCALKPSQPDDGLSGRTKGPIEVAVLDGEPIIIHGNHRYYRRRELIQPTSIPRIEIVIVCNPDEL